MKKFKVVFLFVMVLVLSGCTMKTEYGMEIKKDKSMDFSILMAYDNELIDGMLSMEEQDDTQMSYTDEQRWAMLEESNDTDDNPLGNGFKAKKYEKGEFKGYIYTKTISNIDDISGDKANFSLEEANTISDKVVFVKDNNKYKANFVLTSENQEASTEEYNVGIEMKFVVTLPNKPISHNATKVSDDGKTLTWDLLETGSKNIEFEFCFKDNTMLYVGIGLGIVVLITIIAIVFINKNKNKTVESAPVNSIDSLENNSEPQIEPVVTQSTITQPEETLPSVSDIMESTNNQNNN